MTKRQRTWIGLAGLAAVLVGLNVVGVLRYPGGPLRDPSDDGALWLDLRPADQGSVLVGNSQPSDWALAGRTYDFGLLTIHNATSYSATIESVTPVDPTEGLSLVSVYVRRAGSPSNGIVGFGPSGMDPDPATLQREFSVLPFAVGPGGETPEHDTQVLVVVRSDRAGAFGFSALALDYRIGPFTFHAIQHVALAGCLGPLPPGVTCPPTE